MRTKEKENGSPEKNFRFTAIRIRNEEKRTEQAGSEYRTVYAACEIPAFYMAVEGVNKKCDESDWESSVIIALFRLEGEKTVCLGQKTERLSVSRDQVLFTYETSFMPADIQQESFEAGVYGIVIQGEENTVQSEPLYLMEGSGRPEEYFQIRTLGIDKCCQETENVKRAHSFSSLNIAGLEDVRFYLLALNLLSREWVYEFRIRLTEEETGREKIRIIRGKQYTRTKEGESVLCFAFDPGEGETGFWRKGHYRLEIYCFGHRVVDLTFLIGDKDVEYTYMPGVFRERPLLKKTTDRTVLLEKLYQLVGLRKVKEELIRMYEYADFIRLRRENGLEDILKPMHLWFTGHPGVGREVVAAWIGEMGHSLGLLSTGSVTYYRRQDWEREGENMGSALRLALAKCSGGILYIEDAGDFYDERNRQDPGVGILTLLNDILTRENPPLWVILADVGEEVSLLQSVLPELKQNFQRELYFEEYTPEELMEITRKKLEKRQLCMSSAAEEKFMKLLRMRCRTQEEEVSNGFFIEKQLEEMALCMAKRLMSDRKPEYSRQEMMRIEEADIDMKPETGPEESLEKLKEIIGSEQLKQSIIHHLNYVYFIRERRKYGFQDVIPSLNMLFSGHPGTGKLTVAKMLGEIYYAAGILSGADVSVQNARHLAALTGISPEQAVTLLLSDAEGGILYVEESCALLQTPTGLAIFEMLLASVSPEEYGGKVIILADTPEEIEKMLQLNPALKTYFPFHFQFNDHTPEELMSIADRKLEEKKYILHPKARLLLEEKIRKVYNGRDKHFGNALWMEKMVEAIIRKMSGRLMKIREERPLTYKEMNTVMAADIPEDDHEMPGFRKDVFDETEIQTTLEDMDRLVGQTKIKKQIRDFVELARHYSLQGIKLSTKLSLQWCFTGNTGMGKKALARIIARLYKAMGIIERAEVYHLQVEHLAGMLEEEAQRYIGMALAEANGGILLLDEDAEKVIRTEGMRERVRAILMNQLAINPGSCIILYVGQRPTVQSFKKDSVNGSNLIHILYFEDYTREELMLILKRKLANEHMKMTSSAQQHMSSFIDRLLQTEEQSHASARLIRSLAGWIIRNCEIRAVKNGLTDSQKPLSVTITDVKDFNENLLSFLLDDHRKIGFEVNTGKKRE